MTPENAPDRRITPGRRIERWIKRAGLNLENSRLKVYQKIEQIRFKFGLILINHWADIQQATIEKSGARRESKVIQSFEQASEFLAVFPQRLVMAEKAKSAALEERERIQAIVEDTRNGGKIIGQGVWAIARLIWEMGIQIGKSVKRGVKNGVAWLSKKLTEKNKGKNTI